MAKVVTRECPQCHVVKPFRYDQKTCGCPAPAKEKVEDTVSKSGRVREVNITGTRICNEEQLVEALGIDLTKWYVDKFTVRKWEMGYIASTHKREFPKPERPANAVKDSESATTERADERGTSPTTEPKHTFVDNTADYEQLFAVACVLKRIVTEREEEQYVKENVALQKANRRLSFQLKAEKKYRTTILDNVGAVEESMRQIEQYAAEIHKVLPFELTKVDQVVPEFVVPEYALKPGHDEDAVLLLSDWHCGDVIRPGDTSGFPEFDLPICGNRIGYIVRKAKAILTMHRAMYPIKKLYVWVGGDMGNGDLHDAPVSNSLFMPAQISFTFEMLAMFLEDILELTVPDPVTGVRVIEEVVLLFTCGNHMREATSKFMPMKYQAQRTFDFTIYRMIMHTFKDRPRVTIRQEMSPYIFEEIRGHRYGFAHGMQVGYKNRPDEQAKSMDAFLRTMRGLFDSPEFRRKHGLRGETFSKMCIGDIHVPVWFPRLKSNGSLNGQNELGVNWGLEPIPAGQQLFGVTEKHLQSWEYFIECTHVQRESEDWNRYGHYAADFERLYGRK
ncbi:Uncharacterised protein [uncultured archaeon]|nr:Uncharacterised protein [uncultured archaeon]